MPTQGHRPDPRTRGAALMMTLVMLVLLSILITGFVVSMRTELSVAYSNENIQRTKMVAQAAVSHGIDILRSNIPDPADIGVDIGDKNDSPSRNWISNPGRLIVNLGSSGEEIIDLHTGTQNDGDDITSFDLNQPLAGESSAAIVAVDSGPRPKMRVSWSNILQDPSRAPGTPLENGDVNAITGRYAFWMDDETSKLNFNTASGKNIDAWKWLEDSWLVPYTSVPRGFTTNANASNSNVNYVLGHPATINLDLLFGQEGTDRSNQFDRGRLATHIFTNGWHQYPEAIMEYYDFDGDPEVIDPSEQEWYDKNKWNLTFYSRSPEFNVFGRSRLFSIKDPLALEGGPVYQMPFTSDGVLHLHTLLGGLEHAVTEAAVNEENLNVLVEYFKRDDWPGYNGSFETKWGGPKSAYQVALNIIQMGILASGDLGEGNSQTTGFHKFAVLAAQDITDGTRNDPEEDSARPERDLWRDDQGNLYLPQTLGPHLTECHFDFFVEKDREKPVIILGDREKPREIIRQYNIGFRYSTEYFMHNNGWVVPTVGTSWDEEAENAKISPFPTTIDFLRIKTFPTDHPEYNGGDEKKVVENWGPRQIRGTRNGLFHQNWDSIQHREMIIDIAKGDNEEAKFVIGPQSPERAGAAPGLPARNSHIKVATSKRFYLPWSSTNGDFAHGLVAENQIAEGNSTTPFAFKVVEKYDGKGNQPSNIISTSGQRVAVDFAVRLGMAAPNARFTVRENNPNPTQVFNRPKQMLPLGTTPALDSAPGKAGGTKSTDLEAEEDEVFTYSPESDPPFIFEDLRELPELGFGWRINPGVEPRVARAKSDWTFTTAGIDSAVNFLFNRREQSKFRHLQIGWAPNTEIGKKLRIHTGNLRNQPLNRGADGYTETYRMTSPGYYSLIHTGQQSGDQYRSLSLLPKSQESSTYSSGPPDYILFDLFAPSFCFDAQQWRNAHRLPDSWSTISYMNSTAGQINLNSKIYPDDGGGDFNPPPRLKPLEAVFVHLRQNTAWATEFASAIDAYQESQPFAYVGELAEVPGYSDGVNQADQFRKEEILRNMMPCLTTKSNTFGLWGVAQTVRKSPSNLDSAPERFEEGDQVLGEKRFFALLERYVWPGRDGHPGNAHVDANGIWDRLAEPRRKTEGQIASGAYENVLHDIPGAPPFINPNKENGSGISFAQMDGPSRINMSGNAKLALADAPHTSTSLEEAYNPPHPVMKYRVVYFKYLDQ